jgi:hypothetical protein
MKLSHFGMFASGLNFGLATGMAITGFDLWPLFVAAGGIGFLVALFRVPIERGRV